MVPSSIHSVELKHKDKDLIPPLENDARASRKHYHAGLGKEEEMNSHAGEGRRDLSQIMHCIREHLQRVLKCYSPLREEI